MFFLIEGMNILKTATETLRGALRAMNVAAGVFNMARQGVHMALELAEFLLQGVQLCA